MKRLAFSLAAVALFVGPALADQADVMKKKLGAKLGPAPNAVVPSGFEVAGPTFYELSIDGRNRHYGSTRDARDAKVFWKNVDKDGAGSGGDGAGGGAGR